MTRDVDNRVRVSVVRASGQSFDVLARRAGGRFELLPMEDDAGLPRLVIGEEVSLHGAARDGSIVEQPASVVDSRSHLAVVTPSGQRRRHQRSHARASVGDVEMQLDEFVDAVSFDDDSQVQEQPARELVARVLDISAGGARIEHDGPPLTVGSLWHVATELAFDDGETITIEQVAEVRWALDADGHGHGPGPGSASGDDDATGQDGRGVAGLRFLGIRPGLEEAVERWVAQHDGGPGAQHRDDPDGGVDPAG